MRGDLVTVAMQGDFGKPRPALVIQADQFSEHSSVTVLPLTSALMSAPLLRITVQPGVGNGFVLVQVKSFSWDNHVARLSHQKV